MRILLAVIASVVALALIGFLVLRGNEQTHVRVRSGDVIASNPNRADDYGADTVRAYLTAAIEMRQRGAHAVRDADRRDLRPV